MSQPIIVRLTKAGAWHYLRTDAHTVCGRAVDFIRSSFRPASSRVRACSECDRMKDAASVQLAAAVPSLEEVAALVEKNLRARRSA